MTLIDSGLSSEVFADGPDRVLKLYRAPFEPAAIENEFRATALAKRLGFPVPEAFGLVERDGRMGILFERLEGPTLLRRYARDPGGLILALRRLAVTQAAIHRHSAEGLPAQHARLRTEIGWARVPDDVRAAALKTLDRLPVGTALCHGDIHPGNVLCTKGGLRIIDWQKATAGNPAGDAARTALMIRHGRRGARPDGPAMRAARRWLAFWYLAAYRAESGLGRAEIASWRLPLTVARLCGRWTDQDADILAVARALMRR